MTNVWNSKKLYGVSFFNLSNLFLKVLTVLVLLWRFIIDTINR